MSFPTDYQYLYGQPDCSAQIRQCADDFKVTEIPAFLPEGQGEHLFLRIQKTGENTDWVAKQLAKFCQVPVKDVGYAGKKDRHAVTEQWFSVRLPEQRVLTWSLFETDTIKVLETARHPRKLRLGALAGNRFELCLRNVTDGEALAARIPLIAKGVPNYFGEQRFGHQGGNLDKGVALIKGEFKERQRHKKGLYISAVRSWVFNHLLSERIKAGCWSTPLAGDVMMLDGSRSVFVAESDDATLQQRLDSGDIHITGPLWGRGQLLSQDAAAAWEHQVIAPWGEITERLEHLGLQQERRALRLIPAQLKATEEQPGQWRVSFSLPAGAFATSVLRELCQTAESSAEQND